jgi:Anti-sigma-K factor rskA
MSDQLEPELERVARMLADAGPLPDAPASLRERALAIPDGVQAAEDPDVVPIARRARRGPRPAAWIAIAAAVAAIIIVPAAVLHESSATHRIDLVPRSFAPHSVGSARVVAHGDGSATIELRVSNLPQPSGGRTYEGWLGRVGDRLPLGTFRTDANGTATVTWHVPKGEIGEYRWLWVTSEPAGGAQHPSDHTALWGPLT